MPIVFLRQAFVNLFVRRMPATQAGPPKQRLGLTASSILGRHDYAMLFYLLKDA